MSFLPQRVVGPISAAAGQDPRLRYANGSVKNNLCQPNVTHTFGLNLLQPKYRHGGRCQVDTLAYHTEVIAKLLGVWHITILHNTDYKTYVWGEPPSGQQPEGNRLLWFLHQCLRG